MVFAAGAFGLVIDNTGRVVWYRRFPKNGPGLNFIAQPNGRFTARPPNEPTDLGHWVEVDPLGSVTRELGCARGFRPRLHDFIGETDGLLAALTRWSMDLTGGRRGERIGDRDRRAAPLGKRRRAVRLSPLTTSQWDGNPDDLPGVRQLDARDDRLRQRRNLIVSFRNPSEVTKIDVRTGDVLCLVVVETIHVRRSPTPSFASQRRVRVRAGCAHAARQRRRLTESRAEWYDRRVDAHRTAGSVTARPASSRSSAAACSPTRGHTLASFGTAGRVEEYDADGRSYGIDGTRGTCSVRNGYAAVRARHRPARNLTITDVGFSRRLSLAANRLRPAREFRPQSSEDPMLRKTGRLTGCL